MENNIKIVDESWYSIYIVWGLTVLGLLTVVFGNIFFQIIGIIVVIMGLGVITQIAKKRKLERIENENKVNIKRIKRGINKNGR